MPGNGTFSKKGFIMEQTEIKQKLDQLAEHYARRDNISLEKQVLVDEILTAEIKAKLAEIDDSWNGE